jgi:hypothetical protein
MEVLYQLSYVGVAANPSVFADSLDTINRLESTSSD